MKIRRARRVVERRDQRYYIFSQITCLFTKYGKSVGGRAGSVDLILPTRVLACQGVFRCAPQHGGPCFVSRAIQWRLLSGRYGSARRCSDGVCRPVFGQSLGRPQRCWEENCAGRRCSRAENEQTINRQLHPSLLLRCAYLCRETYRPSFLNYS